jgi:hypothetical protein
MTTRTRELHPDPNGYFRPRIGWECSQKGVLKQPRFNLGTDPREALKRYRRIQDLYDDDCKQKDGRVDAKLWSPRGLMYARELARGKTSILIPDPDLPRSTLAPSAVIEYQQGVEHLRQDFPSLDIVPTDAEAWEESARKNQALVVERIRLLEAELKRMGAMLSRDALPADLSTGTLHEALEASIAEINRDGEKVEGDTLTPHNIKRVERLERLKQFADFPLYQLNLDKCSELIGYWRTRPEPEEGTRYSKSYSEGHVKELDRFFTWLDSTELFKWTKPRGLDGVKRAVPVLAGERKLSAMTKTTYSPEQLAVLNAHATDRERLALYLGINCAMGAAEAGRVVSDDIHFQKVHPFAKQLGVETSEADTFLRMFRPKTGVFGEWILWEPVVEVLRHAVKWSKKQRTDVLCCREGGNALYNTASKNPGAAFGNMWKKLLDRVEKTDKQFPRLPFGSLRDVLPDMLRRDYSDTLASMVISHGNPCTADNLLACYANLPWGRYHAALREVQPQFQVMFDAAT